MFNLAILVEQPDIVVHENILRLLKMEHQANTTNHDVVVALYKK